MNPMLLALTFISTALAVAPTCSQEGNSLQLANGSWPYVMQEWAGVGDAITCQNLCLAADECYAIAFNKGIKQCHGYTDVVGKVGWHSTSSGYLFSDNCCNLTTS
jgi:hypothetical protein